MCVGRKRRADAQAMGRSRGGRSTKLHLVTDGVRGRSISDPTMP